MLPGWTKTGVQYGSIAAIAGLKSTSSGYSALISTVSFSGNNGQLSILVTANANPAIEVIHISYVIYRVSGSLPFSTFNPASASSATYQYLGLTQLNSGNGVVSGYGWNSQVQTGITCVGQNCPSQCITAQTCRSSNGQIISNICYLCAQGQTVVNGACQTPNPCGPNQVQSSTGCVCVNGFVLVNSVCYQRCGTNAYSANGICVCLPGFIATGTPNVCTASTGCGPNYVLSNGVCICPQGFGLIGTQCIVCPANSFIQGGQCTCITGFVLITTTNTCQSSSVCFPNSSLNNLGQCVCNAGFVNQGTQCIPTNTCTGGAIWNGQACVCQLGQYLNVLTQSCVTCSLPGQTISGTNCVCSSNYYPSGGNCVACPNFSTFNPSSNSCVCVSGYTLVNGQCIRTISCPTGSVFNPSTQLCQCTNPSQNVINGVCQACQSGSTWNGNACVCNSGFFLSNSLCYPCSSTCQTCSGPANNQCLTCSVNRVTPVNGVCTSGGTGCNPGFFLSTTGQCSPCLTNCATCVSSTSCSKCISGYTTLLSSVGGNVVVSCVPIPTPPAVPDYFISLKGRVVGNKVLYQGLAMSQMPTGILANGCNICNNLLLIKTVSSFSNVVATTEYIVDSQYWFLTTFTFPNAGFIPDFQFTVQINPIYANFFSSADLLQKISVTINQSTISGPGVATISDTGITGQTGVVNPAVPGSNKAGLAPRVIANLFSPTASSS